VVAQSSAAAALLDAGYQVKAAYGELTPKNGKLDYQAGQLDLSKLTVIGRTYGQFDVEKYAGVDPDLLIDMCYDNKTLWYVPKNDVEQVEQVAPTLGIRATGLDLPGMIDQFMRLSKDLGGDTEGAAVSRAKATYDDALAAVRSAAKTNPRPRVVVMSSSTTNVYIADPEQSPDIGYLRELGVTVPEIKAPAGMVFVTASWERAADRPADVILYDARVPRPTNAAWSRLPAVRAGQVYPWYAAAPYSYRSYGSVYAALAPKLRDARVVTS
jgi:iron complex transport system substrate-binding protein